MWLVSFALLFLEPCFSTSRAESKRPVKVKAGSKAPVRKQPQQEKPELGSAVQAYTSDNFVIYTDLPAEDAQELLTRLETMLKLIAAYWNRPNARVIEMYVVKDLNVWPREAFPPPAWDSVSRGGGLTISRVSQQTNLVTGERVTLAAQSIVYAVADRGTPQHEAVHAYCGQTFGQTGPTWYAEGMAEMGQYWKDKDPSVNCHEFVVRYLKSETPKPLTEITADGQRSGDDWRNYAWRWALCHLLANNTNYAQRFRPLGLALLLNDRANYQSVYGAMDEEIEFEYQFFLKHFDVGYRVDLCSWDWKTKFNPLKGTGTVQAKIEACHGWQPSRLLAREGHTYSFSTTGTWKLSQAGEHITPEGTAAGLGKLVGILFDDYRLSEPFELGAAGEWTAPQNGKLFLRCQDGWCDLADNKGAVTVKWKQAD